MSTLPDRRLAVLPAYAPTLPEKKTPFHARLLAAVATRRRGAASRRALAEMSPRTLDDIGVSRIDTDVDVAASKPSWRA